jgi:hypothetical protein
MDITAEAHKGPFWTPLYSTLRHRAHTHCAHHAPRRADSANWPLSASLRTLYLRDVHPYVHPSVVVSHELASGRDLAFGSPRGATVQHQIVSHMNHEVMNAEGPNLSGIGQVNRWDERAASPVDPPQGI